MASRFFKFKCLEQENGQTRRLKQSLFSTKVSTKRGPRKDTQGQGQDSLMHVGTKTTLSDPTEGRVRWLLGLRCTLWADGWQRECETLSNALLGNIESWNSCRCCFDMYHAFKHCYRTSTPLHGSSRLSRKGSGLLH